MRSTLADAAALPWQFALGDAVGPVSEIFEGSAAEISGKRLSSARRTGPIERAASRRRAGIELAETIRYRTRGFLAS